MLPSSAAPCEKSKRRRRVGREPILRRLGTVHGHWCCWIDVAPDVNKNGEGSGSSMPRFLCLTSEHLMPPSGFSKTRGPIYLFFHLNAALTARPMISIWHKSQSRRAASSNKHSGKTGHYDLSILQEKKTIGLLSRGSFLLASFALDFVCRVRRGGSSSVQRWGKTNGLPCLPGYHKWPSSLLHIIYLSVKKTYTGYISTLHA